MSVYRCEMCERIVDGDYEGCFAHPTDDCACICESCDMECRDSDEFETREFTDSQYENFKKFLKGEF